MGIAEIAKKVAALEAELAAKSSRIDDLEAMVLLLEAENAHLRKAVVSDGKEEGMGAVGINKGRNTEEGVPAVPTPVKFAVRAATDQSDDDVEIMDTEGGGGGDHGSVRCDVNVCLDDDDVSSTPRGKKRAAALVVSDSDSEDEDDGGHGNKEVGTTSSRKRALRGLSDDENEDGGYGVRAVSPVHSSRVVKTGMESEDDDAVATRRSARLVESRSKRIRPARRALEFVEPKDHEVSEEDSSEECDSMDGFIDDGDCSEHSSDSAEESSAEPEEFGNEENCEDTMASMRGKKIAKNEWEYEGDILSAFAKQPELCLKAVCALYRKQTEEEKAQKSTIVQNKKGFSQIDAPRGSRIAQFLLDGDALGPLKKTAQDLEKSYRDGVDFCHEMASRYSKQLFAIYKNKDDPYFP